MFNKTTTRFFKNLRIIVLLMLAFAVIILPLNTVSGKTLLKIMDNPSNSAYSLFGQTITSSDLDNDGKLEILIGAEKERVAEMPGQGRVYVFDSQGELLFDLTTREPQEEAFFGSYILTDDLDNDGRQEILISASGEDVNGYVGAGKVYLFNPQQEILKEFVSPNKKEFSAFGTSLATIDFNGDGFKDIIIGSPFENTLSTVGALGGPQSGAKAHGRVYIFSGKDYSLLSTLEPENTDRQYNFGVTLAHGDLNQDGKPELIIGATGEEAGSDWEFVAQGELFIYELDGAGSFKLLRSLTTPNPEHYAYFGSALLVSGSQIIIGSPGEMVGKSLNQGRVYIYDWATQAFAFMLTLPGESAKAGFGYTLALGEVNEDEILDYIISAPLENLEDKSKQGKVYAFCGASKSLLYAITSINPENNANFGISLLFTPKEFGGLLLVGSPGEKFQEGRVYVYNPHQTIPWWGYVFIITFLALLGIYTTIMIRRFARVRSTYLYLMSKRKDKNTPTTE